VEVHKRIVSGSKFQVDGDGVATEKARRAMSVLVLETKNRGAWTERRCLVGSARLVRLLRYAGVDVARTLCVRTVVLYMMRWCRTGSQWSDRRRGLASDRPSRWQTTLVSPRCSALGVTCWASQPAHRKAGRYSFIKYFGLSCNCKFWCTTTKGVRS